MTPWAPTKATGAADAADGAGDVFQRRSLAGARAVELNENAVRTHGDGGGAAHTRCIALEHIHRGFGCLPVTRRPRAAGTPEPLPLAVKIPGVAFLMATFAVETRPVPA